MLMVRLVCLRTLLMLRLMMAKLVMMTMLTTMAMIGLSRRGLGQCRRQMAM